MVNVQMDEQDLKELLRLTQMLAEFNRVGMFTEHEINSTPQAMAGGLRHLPVANDLRGLSPEAADAVTRKWVEDVERSGADYCKKRNSGLSGRSAVDSPEQQVIDNQVADYLKRGKQRGWFKRKV